jgi:hypothetical protein
MPDQQTAVPLVQIRLGERKCLMYPNTGSPQHNDQTPHPTAVTTVSGLAHNRNDLVDRERIRRMTTAVVRRDPPDVMVGHRRRRPRSAGCGSDAISLLIVLRRSDGPCRSGRRVGVRIAHIGGRRCS